MRAGGTIVAGGHVLHVAGDVCGPCLLVHGAGQGAAVLEEVAAQVPGAWTVDLPGHGASPGPGLRDVGAYADVVLRLVESVAPEGLYLGGHSMGGAVALTAALAHPQGLQGLILMASSARLRVHPDLLAALRDGPMPPSFRAMLFAPESAALETRLPEGDAEVELGDYLACDAFDVRDRLDEIHLPALVLVGDLDRMTPPERARSLAQGLGAEFETIPGAGHMLPLEAPTAVAAAIRKFLARGER